MAEVVVINKLKPFVQQIERLNEEQAAIAEAIKEKYAEAKAEGFDVKCLRAVIAERKKSPHDISEFEEIKQLYRDALS